MLSLLRICAQMKAMPQVLGNTNHCLHVQLTATKPLIAADKKLNQGGGFGGDGGDCRNSETPVILLSGFVSHQQVNEALKKHCSIWTAHDKELVIKMKGPGMSFKSFGYPHTPGHVEL